MYIYTVKGSRSLNNRSLAGDNEKGKEKERGLVPRAHIFFLSLRPSSGKNHLYPSPDSRKEVYPPFPSPLPFRILGKLLE